jgi:hypothetical protein
MSSKPKPKSKSHPSPVQAPQPATRPQRSGKSTKKRSRSAPARLPQPNPFRLAPARASILSQPPRGQFLKGKLTFIGIGISALGALSKVFGVPVPVEEIKGILGWFQANWGTLTELAGLVVAAYGRLRINWRKEGAR